MHFGAPWPISFAGIVRSKFGNDPLKRKMALEGHRFTPQEALEVGIVDYVVNGNTAAVLARAEQLGDQWSGNAQGGVWGSIKVEPNLSYSIMFDTNQHKQRQSELYRDVLETIHKDARPRNPLHDDAAAKARL